MAVTWSWTPAAACCNCCAEGNCYVNMRTRCSLRGTVNRVTLTIQRTLKTTFLISPLWLWHHCWLWQSLDREHLQQHAVIFVQRGTVTWICALVVHWGEQSSASDWRFKERWRPRFWSHHFGSGIIVGSGNHLIVNTCNRQWLLQRGITAEGNYYVNARTLCSEYWGEQSKAWMSACDMFSCAHSLFRTLSETVNHVNERMQ